MPNDTIGMVSVIIPAYNTGSLIGRCLASVVSQTYKKLEILVINDASTDDTFNVIRDFAIKDSRIIIINLTRNSGNGVARNIGIGKANGDYVYFIDSDDYIEKDAIELSVDAISKSHSELLVVGHKEHLLPSLLKKDRLVDKIPSALDGMSKEQVLKCFLLQTHGLSIPPWKYFVKKEMLVRNNIVFDESGHFFEDVIFSTRLLYFANSISVLQRPLYHYVMRKSSIMGSYSSRFIESKFYALHTLREFLKKERVFDLYREEFSMFFLIDGFLASCICYSKMNDKSEEVKHFLYEISQSVFIQGFNVELLKGIDAESQKGIRYIRDSIKMIQKDFNRYISSLIFAEKIRNIINVIISP